MNQGKLNCRRPSSLTSVSDDPVFPMTGVMSEGPDEVDYLKLLIVMVFYCWNMSGFGGGCLGISLLEIKIIMLVIF